MDLAFANLIIGNETEDLEQIKASIIQTVTEKSEEDMNLLDEEDKEAQLELCPTQDSFKILRSEVSPLLLAVKDRNVAAFKKLLAD
jgi:hypothetical protein